MDNGKGQGKNAMAGNIAAPPASGFSFANASKSILAGEWKKSKALRRFRVN